MDIAEGLYNANKYAIKLFKNEITPDANDFSKFNKKYFSNGKLKEEDVKFPSGFNYN